MSSTKVFLSSLFFALFTSFLAAQVIIRGAFDIGSGEIKFTVAAVEDETNSIVKVYYNKAKTLSIRNELLKSKDGVLSQSLEDKVVFAIGDLLEETKSFSIQEVTAIATSVFRVAKNGKSFLASVQEKTQVPIHLISWEEEGSLGLRSASYVSKKESSTIVSWDSGSGSFQITGIHQGKPVVYGAEFGFAHAYKTLFSIRGLDTISYQVNPVYYHETEELIKSIRPLLPLCPSWLVDSKKEVIGIGGNHCIFAIASIATGKKTFTKQDVKLAIHQFSGKQDSELQSFPKVHEVVVALSFLYTVMDHTAIDQVTFYETNGGCEGILITPNLWHIQQ